MLDRQTIELLRLLETIDITADPAALQLFKAALATGDPKLIQILLDRIRPMQIHNLINPNPFLTPPVKAVDGFFRLGRLTNNGYYGTFPLEHSQHFLVTGSSGSGKSNLLYLLANHFLEFDKQFPNQVKVFIFAYKKDFRGLIKYFPDILGIPWEDYRINPLNPMGIDFNTYINTFIDVLGHSLKVWLGTRANMRERINHLKQNLGRQPTIHDFIEELKKQRSKKGRYRDLSEAALIKLESMLYQMEAQFDCETGIPFDKLHNQNLILEIPEGLGREFRSFNVLYPIFWIYLYRASLSPEQQKQFPLTFFMLDEGAEIFDKRTEEQQGETLPIIHPMLSQSRQHRLGFQVGVQIYSNLATSIKANNFTTITLNAVMGEDLMALQRSLSLTREQRAFIGQLRTGEAVVKTRKYPEPFIIKIPKYNMPIVSDSEFTTIMKPRIDRMGIVPRHRPEAHSSTGVSPESPKKQKSEKSTSHLNSLLHECFVRPFSPTTEKYRKLNLSPKNGKKQKDEAIVRGYLELVEVKTGKRGASLSLLIPTQAAADILNVSLPHLPGKGGIEHKFWQHTIKSFYENLGFKAEIEKSIAGKSIDVLVQNVTHSIALEVALSGPEQELINISKNLEIGVAEIIVAYRSKPLIKRLRKLIKEDVFVQEERISFKELHEFLTDSVSVPGHILPSTTK